MTRSPRSSNTKAKKSAGKTRAAPLPRPTEPTSAGSMPGRATDTPALLSGGNPQIAKGDGEAPVLAYVAAMPGWKREVGEQLDALVTRVVPGVRKAVRWNSPFYGVEGRGWFLSFHCFTKYVKVTFLNGASLSPPPPIASKHAAVRYVHVGEGEHLDVARLTGWIAQAAKLPGDPLF